VSPLALALATSVRELVVVEDATASRRNSNEYGMNTILSPTPNAPSAQVSTKPGELHVAWPRF
jgi:hypothetical protein